MDHLDHLRTGTNFGKPRGHADHYAAVLTEAVTADGDLGVFFLHNAGYSTMCGHAILAITKVVFQIEMFSQSGGYLILCVLILRRGE